jgi:hypothetical protein
MVVVVVNRVGRRVHHLHPCGWGVGFEFGFLGLGFEVSNLGKGFGVWSLGFGGMGLGFWVYGFAFEI